jgi:tRNA threonylcarbamoyladenosine biosynthesis protein TsaB
MKILGLDSSGLVAGVAVVEDDVLLAEYNVNYKKTHSQTLLPMLDEIRNMLELDLNSLDAVAIASGPGSFTGLRIGSATAKGLGLALDLPLVEVPTLEGLAYNLCGVHSMVCPLIDARRSQVYTGVYEFVKQDASGFHTFRLETMMPQAAIPISDLIDEVNRLGAGQPGREVIFLGDGVPVYRQKLIEDIKIPFSFAPAGSNRQRAASVAALGAVYYRLGRTVSAAEHQPEYLRKSQAERELAAKESK